MGWKNAFKIILNTNNNKFEAGWFQVLARDVLISGKDLQCRKEPKFIAFPFVL